MLKFTALLLCFFVHLHISNVGGHIFESLEKLDLPAEQKKHIPILKSQLRARSARTYEEWEKNIRDMFNFTSISDLSALNNYLRNISFLEICPQLIQTMDDLSYSLPINPNIYNIIMRGVMMMKYPEYSPKKYEENAIEIILPNRTVIEQLNFSQQDAWKIYMHWIIYRFSESEKITLGSLHDFQDTCDLFRKMQVTFAGPHKKERLKRIVLDLGKHVSTLKPPESLADLKKRFSGLEKTIDDIKKYNRTTHFVHVFLPYRMKDERDFLGLSIWLMFRIDDKEEEDLQNEYPKIYDFRAKFRGELRKVEEIGQSMDITWQVASNYMIYRRSEYVYIIP